MRKVYLAELRDSWSAWLGVSLAFFVTNLSFAISALVLASGEAAVDAGLLDRMDSAEFTLIPYSNFVFSGMVGLMVISTGASMVVDSRRGGLARLAVAGATPAQIVRSVLTQLAVVSLACAALADLVALACLQPYLHFLTFGTGSGLQIPEPPAVYDLRVVLLANLGVLLVSVLGGLGQALRAARIAPVEALRQAAAQPAQGMTILRWLGATVCLLGVAATFAAIVPLTGTRGRETVSMVMQIGLAAMVLFVVMMALLAPAIVSPLARALTALVPLRTPAWQIARRNVDVRGTRFAPSVVPVIFTIGLMLGLLAIGPTIAATTTASGYTETVELDKAGMGAFLSLLGPALAVALAGGIGNIVMMSKQRDAELALLGIAGATPAQRRLLPLLEALILTATAAVPAVLALGVMAGYYTLGFSASGLTPAFRVPASAWATGIGGTALILMAATFVPTLGALRQPEPRVVARLAAE